MTCFDGHFLSTKSWVHTSLKPHTLIMSAYWSSPTKFSAASPLHLRFRTWGAQAMSPHLYLQKFYCLQDNFNDVFSVRLPNVCSSPECLFLGVLAFTFQHSVPCSFSSTFTAFKWQRWRSHLPLSLLSQTSKSAVTHPTCLLNGEIIHSSVANSRIAAPGLNWGEQALCHLVLEKNHPSLH